jgi:hypothetical protein
LPKYDEPSIFSIAVAASPGSGPRKGATLTIFERARQAAWGI